MTTLLEEMVAKGMSPQAILEVTRMIADREQLAERRARDAAYMRDYRARKPYVGLRKITSSYADVPLCKEERKKVSKKHRGAISPDWVPDDEDRAYARARGWGDDRITSEAELCRDYYLASGKVMSDWHAVWRRWVRSPYRSSAGRQPGQSNKERNREFMDGLNEYIARGETRRADGGDVSPQGHLMLPVGSIDPTAGVQHRNSARVVPLLGAGGDRRRQRGNGSEPDVPAAGPTDQKTLR